MSPLIKIAWSFLLIPTLSVSLAAQSSQQKKPAGEKPLEPSANEQGGSGEKFIPWISNVRSDHLIKLFDIAKDCEDDRPKVRIQAQIVDALWEYDEPRARREFEDAFHAIAGCATRGSNSSLRGSPRSGCQRTEPQSAPQDTEPER